MSDNMINKRVSCEEIENVVQIHDPDSDYPGQRPHYKICNDGSIDYDLDFVLFHLEKRIKQYDQLEFNDDSRSDSCNSNEEHEMDEVQPEPEKMTPSQIRKIINPYMKSWQYDLKNWKFQGDTHATLLMNMFDPVSVPNKMFNTVLKYLEHVKSTQTGEDYISSIEPLLSSVQLQLNSFKHATEVENNKDEYDESRKEVIDRMHHAIYIVDNFEIRSGNKVLTPEELITLLNSNIFPDIDFSCHRKVEENCVKKVPLNQMVSKKCELPVSKNDVNNALQYLKHWESGKSRQFSLKLHKILPQVMFDTLTVTDDMFSNLLKYLERLKGVQKKEFYNPTKKMLLVQVQEQLNLLKLKTNNNKGDKNRRKIIERMHRILNIIDNFEIRRENKVLTVKEFITSLNLNTFSDIHLYYLYILEKNDVKQVPRNQMVKKKEEPLSRKNQNVNNALQYLKLWKSGSNSWQFSLKLHKILLQTMFETNMLSGEMFNILIEYISSLNKKTIPEFQDNIERCMRLLARISRKMFSDLNNPNKSEVFDSMNRNEIETRVIRALDISPIRKRQHPGIPRGKTENKENSKNSPNHTPAKQKRIIRRSKRLNPLLEQDKDIKVPKQKKKNPPTKQDKKDMKVLKKKKKKALLKQDKETKVPKKKKKKQKNRPLFFVDKCPEPTIQLPGFSNASLNSIPGCVINEQ